MELYWNPFIIYKQFCSYGADPGSYSTCPHWTNHLLLEPSSL